MSTSRKIIPPAFACPPPPIMRSEIRSHFDMNPQPDDELPEITRKGTRGTGMQELVVSEFLPFH